MKKEKKRQLKPQGKENQDRSNLPTLTSTEQAKLESLRARRAAQGKPPKVSHHEGPAGNMVLDISSEQLPELQAIGLSQALGVTDADTMLYLMRQVNNLVKGKLLVGSQGSQNPKSLTAQTNAALALLHDVKPQGGLEAMLAVQIVGVHALAVEMLSQAGDSHERFVVNEAIGLANKLMRTFTNQLDALQRLRGNVSQQKMVVEHVHVEAGGQAVVGQVANKGERG